jgi:hypothetical protein
LRKQGAVAGIRPASIADLCPAVSGVHADCCCCQAADEGDLELAQQLWGSLQAEGLAPSHCFMNGFLM